MFDAGFWELLVIGVLALVVVGPERLPRLARTVGLWVGRARHAFYSVRDEIEREADAEGLRDTERAIRESVRETEHTVRRSVRETEKEIRPESPSTDSPPETGSDDVSAGPGGGGASGEVPTEDGKDTAARGGEDRHG
jgi:sec-independent protein translocase protein TatB